MVEVFKFEEIEAAEKRKKLKSLLNLAMKAIISRNVKIAQETKTRRLALNLF